MYAIVAISILTIAILAIVIGTIGFVAEEVKYRRRANKEVSPRRLAKATAEAEKAYWEYLGARAKLQELVKETNGELVKADKVLGRQVSPLL